MFNQLRMDLYRVRRSKSVYICFGILLAFSVVIFGVLWFAASPKGPAEAIRIKLFSAEEAEAYSAMLYGVDTLELFRQTCLDDQVVFGIWFLLFVCMDFQGGFIKNVMVLHQNRWNYVGSKLMAAGIVNFCYLTGHLAFTLLLNWLFGNMVPYTGWGNLLFYLSWAWLLTMAFAALTLFVCVLTRSVAAGSIAVLLLGSGLVVMMLHRICSIFHIENWLNYTISMTLSLGPGQYTSPRDLYVYAVGAGFLAIYAAAAGLVLGRQDI